MNTRDDSRFVKARALVALCVTCAMVWGLIPIPALAEAIETVDDAAVEVVSPDGSTGIEEGNNDILESDDAPEEALVKDDAVVGDSDEIESLAEPRLSVQSDPDGAAVIGTDQDSGAATGEEFEVLAAPFDEDDPDADSRTPLAWDEGAVSSWDVQSGSYEPNITANVRLYNPQNCDKPRTSYLHTNASGHLERVEFVDGSLIVETLSASLLGVDSRRVIASTTYAPSDLASSSNFCWGGFYSGAKYNFVVTGQTNAGEDDKLSVYRISKYNKSWSFLAAAELSAATAFVPKGLESVVKTTGSRTPFASGGCVMEELGGELHVRTSHLMYKDSNGIAHQSNVHIVVNESTMAVKDSMTYKLNQQQTNYGYVSHSFAQRLAALSGSMYALDQGDTYPRAVTIKRLGATGNNATVLAIRGTLGNNSTGVTLGGFESSASAQTLLGTGVTYDQSGTGEPNFNAPRNAYVSVTTPSLSTSITYLTSYASDGKLGADFPKLVKVDDGRFLALWAEVNCWGQRTLPNTRQTGKVRYVFLDGSGKKLGTIKTVDALLSDCDPMVHNGRIMWFAEDISGEHAPIYYSIDAATGAFERVESKGTLADASVASIPAKTYTGAAIEPTPAVTLGGRKLVAGSDFTVAYKNNTNVGTATVIVTGINGYEGEKKATFVINKGTATITASDITVEMGKTASVGATASKGAGKLSYESSDKGIVTVSTAGKLTPVKPGVATVTITAAENTNCAGATKAIAVTVSRRIPTITATAKSLVVGKTVSIGASVTSGAGALSYASGDEAVATVSSAGQLKGVGAGKTTVTITSAENDAWASASKQIEVTVTGTPTITAANKSLKLGTTGKVEASVTSGAGALSYKSSNAKVVKVSTNGTLTPVAIGEATITITSAATANWKSATARITVVVTDKPTITASSKTLYANKTLSIGATVTSGAGKLSYESADEGVVTVSSTGLLKPVAAGETQVTITSAATKYWMSATKKITVKVQRATPTISVAASKTLTAGKTASLGASVTSGAGELSYSTSNQNVVTVSPAGKLTGVSPGKATVTVTSAENGKWAEATAKVSVTVKGPQTITATNKSVDKGKTVSVGATLTNGTGALSYKSSNEKVVTVSDEGVLTGVKQGTATVTITAAASGVWTTTTAKITVTVKATPTITASDKTVYMGSTASIGATVTTGAGKLTYTSSDEDVVTVSTAGRLTPVEVGTATITIKAAAKGVWKATTKKITVTVKKRTNPMVAKAVARSASFTTLKSRDVTTSPISVTNAQGTVSYKKVSGDSPLTLDTATGKVKVAKGTAKGTYTMKVQVKAEGNTKYLSRTTTVTATITVK